MKEANISFLASSLVRLLNNITDFVKNHSPSIIANKLAKKDNLSSPVNPNTGNTDNGIRNKV